VPGEGEVPGVGEYGINATLGDPNGNPSELGSTFYGHAYVLGEGGSGNICASGAYTWVGGDNETLEGTKKWDVLSGNDAANTIWGRKGNDTIFGLGGNDLIEGHDGNDTVYGGTEDDTINGNAGDDTLEGNSGLDTINGGSANDLLHGNAGNDTLSGQDGADTVWGDESVDSLFGNAGSDKLRARDETRDATVNCGEDIDEPTQKDAVDPLVNCE
jgi:Ca2+-binding RTX toxin-like protein